MRKLLRRLLVSLHKHYIGDLVQIGSALEVYEIAARYYDENLNIIYILRTKDNKLIAEGEEYLVEYKGSI